MLTSFSLWVALALFASIGAGLYRIARGPSAPDYMLAAQLFGTTGVAVVLLLARGLELPALVDVALVFTALAAVAAAAFAASPPDDPDRSREDDGTA